MKTKDLEQEISKLWKAVDNGKTEILLLQTDSPQSLRKNVFSAIKKLKGKPLVQFYKMDSFLPDSFFPFINIIQEKFDVYSVKELEKILEEKNIYKLIIPVLLQIIKGIFIEGEEVLQDEVNYEKLKIMEAITLLLNDIQKKEPFVLFIENSEYLSSAGLDYFRYLSEHEVFCPFFVVLTFTYHVNFYSKMRQNLWDHFIIDHTFVLGDVNSSFKNLPNEYADLPISVFISKLHNNLIMNSFQDMVLLCEWLYPQFELFSSDLYLKEQKEIAQFYGIALLYLKENDKALLYFNLLLYFSQESGDMEGVLRSYRYLAMASIAKEDFNGARNFVEKGFCNQISERSQKEMIYLLDTMMRLNSHMKIYSLEQSRGFYSQLLNWTNNNYYLRLRTYWLMNKNFYEPDFPSAQMEYMEEGLKLAKFYGNNFRLASAYHSLASSLFCKGKEKEVLHYFDLSYQLRKDIRDSAELAYYYNGNGYFHTAMGLYKEAEKNFHLALENLGDTQNFIEIGMVKYNMAFNALLSNQYSLAEIYCLHLIELLKVIDIDNLPLHSFSDINTLLGISYLMTGKYLKAVDLYHKMERDGMIFTPERSIERLFSFLLEILLMLYKNDPSWKKNMDECEALIAENYQILCFYLPFFYSVLYMNQNTPTQLSEKARIDGLRISKDVNNQFYEDLFNNLETSISLDSPGKEFPWILRAAEMNHTNKMLNKNLHKYGFLNIFQKTIIQFKSEKKFFEYTIRLLKMNFLLDEIFIFEYYQENSKVKYSTIQFDDFYNLNKLMLIFKDLRQQTKIKESPLFDSVKEILPELQEGLIIPYSSVAGKVLLFFVTRNKRQNPIDSESNETLVLALKIGSMVLERILHGQEIEEKNIFLQKAVRTDNLTTLNNRKSLTDRLIEEQERIERYGDKSQTRMAVMFLDLDNFKYYNDSFGHEAGDLLLKEFAHSLIFLCRKVDFIARYGGDEFVIILPETGKEGAVDLAERIFSYCLHRNYFRDTLEAFLNYSIEIDEKDQLTCSIGIYCNYENIFNPDQILSKADKALYQAKAMGKNCYRVYSS